MPKNCSISLSSNEVHVWRFGLSKPDEAILDYYELLSSEERARAERFHFSEHSKRYIVGRGTLRMLLARYANQAPAELRFEYTDHGKPLLRDSPIRFNLSHSDNLALFAVTLGRDIGVDIERIRRSDDLLTLADYCFAPEERSALRALTPQQRAQAFFRCWTRKEAYIKARGDGLSLDLHTFAVSLGPGEPAALLRTMDDPAEPSRWSIFALRPHTEYEAALAVEDRDRTVRVRGEELAA